MGQVNHAPQAEDQRQPEREQDVVRPDKQAVDDLLEQQHVELPANQAAGIKQAFSSWVG